MTDTVVFMIEISASPGITYPLRFAFWSRQEARRAMLKWVDKHATEGRHVVNHLPNGAVKIFNSAGSLVRTCRVAELTMKGSPLTALAAQIE